MTAPAPTRPSLSSRFAAGGWVLAALGACAFLFLTGLLRVRRIDYVSDLAGGARRAEVDAASPTGQAGGVRALILPARVPDSYQAIMQTQQMFARREWRVRQVDYDNAPAGRDVSASSPYRWWLGLVAWVDHAISGRPIGLSIESAARYADPLLQGLLLVGAAAFTAWHFGAFAAGLVSIGLAACYPLNAGFLPGLPDPHGLARAGALAGVLLLLAGLRVSRGEAPGAAPKRAARRFVLAGVAGGLGLWVSPATQVPFIAGTLLGGLLAAGIARRGGADGGTPAVLWRTWALAGAITVLAAYLLEFAPGHLGGWQLESVHPLYGVAWLGAGELLAWTAAAIQTGRPSWRFRDIAGAGLGAAALAALPLAVRLADAPGFLAPDLLTLRLTKEVDGVVATSVWAWLRDSGFTPTLWATLLPLAVLLPAGWLIARPGTDARRRGALAFALGPAAVALVFAAAELSRWTELDLALLALLVAAVAESAPPGRSAERWLWSVTAALFMVPGAARFWPPAHAAAGATLTSTEAEELIERDLAQWLARHAGEAGAVVFAPPDGTLGLCFYGGLRGIGTLSIDNQEGLRGTSAIARVTTLEEAEVLVRRRGIRYIAIPSWDPYFDDVAPPGPTGAPAVGTMFIPGLKRWNLPPWLRPIAYPMPQIGGFEDQSVLLLEVVDEQSPAAAASRLAEYFVDIGELDRAAAVGEGLRRFPGDVGALAARAQVANARGDAAALEQTLEALSTRLASGADRYLPWDRRVSLAIVLARAKRIELAREQVRRCLAELDARKVRSLSTGSLYNLLALDRAFGLPVADPRLRPLALELLPADLRARLGP